MVVENNFVPSPHDFGDYVYCGVNWALDKRRAIPKTMPRDTNLSLGQKNEGLCIDWVLKKGYLTEKQILFNGTGSSNENKLISEIKSSGITMQCQPDLIVRKHNKNLLYEFKAVSKLESLQLAEFDSVHAQIWCYSNLKKIKIDQYYLLRYFIDPSMKIPYTFNFRLPHSPYELKELTSKELNNEKFSRLFQQYIAAIENLNDPNLKEAVLEKLNGANANKLIMNWFNPSNDTKKCDNCSYRRKNVCEIEINPLDFLHELYS